MKLLCALVLKVLCSDRKHRDRRQPIALADSVHSAVPTLLPLLQEHILRLNSRRMKEVPYPNVRHSSLSHLLPYVNSFFCVSPILFPKEEFLDKTRMSLLPATKNPMNAFSSSGLSNLGIQPSPPTPILLMQVLNHPSNRSAIQKSRLPKGGCLWIRQRLVTGIN